MNAGAAARFLGTLALGLAGSAALAWTGAPAAWLCGAMVAVAAAGMLGAPVLVPGPARILAFLLLGTTIGDAVTPETVALVRVWPASFLALALAVVAMTAASTWYLSRVRGWSPETARFSSIPGGLSQVLAIAVRSGGDLPRISLAQSLRLFVLVAVVPWVLAPPGGAGPPAAPAPEWLSAGEMAAVLGSSALGGLLLERLGVPGGAFLGAMVPSALLHALGLVDGRLPGGLVTASYVVTGCLIGSRFGRVSPASLLATARGALESVALALAISAAFAFVMARALGLSFGQLWLAYAPGGVEAMTILAFVLGADPAFVGAHHMARLLALNVAVPLWLSMGRPKA